MGPVLCCQSTASQLIADGRRHILRVGPAQYIQIQPASPFNSPPLTTTLPNYAQIHNTHLTPAISTQQFSQWSNTTNQPVTFPSLTSAEARPQYTARDLLD